MNSSVSSNDEIMSRLERDLRVYGVETLGVDSILCGYLVRGDASKAVLILLHVALGNGKVTVRVKSQEKDLCANIAQYCQASLR